MNCRQFEDVVSEWARGGLLEAGLAEGAGRHVIACPRCAERLEAERRLTGALEAVAATTAFSGAPARLEVSLRAAFRDESAARRAREGVARRGWLRWAGPAVAAAVPLVIGLGVLFVDRDVKTARLASSEPVSAEVLPSAAGDELTTEFLPLLYEQEIAPDEPTHLVRVELPRSALTYFGFPFQEVSGADSVRADVLLAEDGTPQAIRFVR